LLIKKGPGRRPAPQNPRAPSEDKRITRRREKHQMREADSDMYTDREDVLIKKGAGRRPAPQNAREASDDKTIARRRDKHQMRKVDSDKYADRENLAD